MTSASVSSFFAGMTTCLLTCEKPTRQRVFTPGRDCLNRAGAGQEVSSAIAAQRGVERNT